MFRQTACHQKVYSDILEFDVCIKADTPDRCFSKGTCYGNLRENSPLLCFAVLLIDRWVDWLINWSIDWPIDWLIDWLIGAADFVMLEIFWFVYCSSSILFLNSEKYREINWFCSFQDMFDSFWILSLGKLNVFALLISQWTRKTLNQSKFAQHQRTHS